MVLKASDKALFYHQLGNLLAGGVGLRRALESLKQYLPKANLKNVAESCLRVVQQGQPLSLGLKQRRDWFRSYEVALFEAGEKAGQLSEVSYQLSQFWSLYAKVQSQFFRSLLYPFFLIHLAFFVMGLVEKGLSGVGLSFFVNLIGFYIFIITLFILGNFYRSALQKFLIKLPGFRLASLAGPLYRFIFSLRLQLQAGIPLLEAVTISFQASEHPVLQKMKDPILVRLREGVSLTEALTPLFGYSPYLKSFFATGEASGKILDSLQFVENNLAQQWQETFQKWSQGLARLIYFIIMLYVAYQIISFYRSYYDVTQWNDI